MIRAAKPNKVFSLLFIQQEQEEAEPAETGECVSPVHPVCQSKAPVRHFTLACSSILSTQE